MRNFLLILVITGLMYALACAKPAAPPIQVEAANAAPAQTNDDAPRISLADAKKEFDAGTAVIIDARSADAYKQEHIKGALNITTETLDANYKSLPKDKKIIVYCS